MTRLEYLILKSSYPDKSSIVLDKTSVGGIPYNSKGKVIYIDQIMDTILVEFETGKRSSLIYGKDMFHQVRLLR